MAGLEAVYSDRRAELWRFVCARTSADAADDILQDLWLKIRSVDRPIDDPLGYLFRTADNLIIDRHRSGLRRSRRDDAWQAERLAIDPLRPDELTATREQIALAERRLRALGPRTFDMFVMFRIHGMAQRSIAERFQVGLSTVEKELQRAYRAIADLKVEHSGIPSTAPFSGDNDD